MSRTHALARILVLPAAVAAFAAGSGIADAKGSKAQFNYQDHPNGNQKCSGCGLFVPGPQPGANGACRVVDGAISPNGWCTAYAAK